MNSTMPWVFLHGLGQSPDSWRQTIAALGPSWEDSICPPLVSRANPTYEAAYRSLCDKLEAGPKQIAICGLSLGAVLALRYGAEHPGQVGGLVLIAPQYASPKVMLRLQNLIFRMMPSSAFSGTGLGKAEMIGLCASMAGMDLTGQLHMIRCPELVVCGERDKANRKAAEKLAELLPNSKLHIIPNAGHEVNQNAHTELAAIIKSFSATL